LNSRDRRGRGEGWSKDRVHFRSEVSQSFLDGHAAGEDGGVEEGGELPESWVVGESSRRGREGVSEGRVGGGR